MTRQQVWYQKNKEHVKTLHQQYRQADPQYDRKKNIKYRYGIDLAEYQALFIKQNGCCAICKEKASDLGIDHNHANKQVRGLLCNACNQAIGLLKEKEENFLNALTYLMGK